MALPPSTSVAELDIESKVVALQRVISGRDKNLPSRLGHVQLVIFLDLLEKHVRQDRLNNLIVAKPGVRDETQAIDMFIISSERVSNCKTSRGRIWTLKQIGRKWKDMVGSLVLLLLIFSRTAEISV